MVLKLVKINVWKSHQWNSAILVAECLEKRALDPDENVRLEVVQAITAAFKKDVSAVLDELQIKLLDVVKNRTLDKKVCELRTFIAEAWGRLSVYITNRD